MVKITIASNIETISANNVEGQFGLKRCQKKRKVMNYYMILQDFARFFLLKSLVLSAN